MLGRGVIIDVTSLKVYDGGEWKTCKHGNDKRHIWCKLRKRSPEVA
ncbi:hypothetical protein [Candidatus Enterovibrio escicola]|nr:hypothetical protein [Candidatus Enterovibrio escacola]